MSHDAEVNPTAAEFPLALFGVFILCLGIRGPLPLHLFSLFGGKLQARAQLWIQLGR